MPVASSRPRSALYPLRSARSPRERLRNVSPRVSQARPSYRGRTRVLSVCALSVATMSDLVGGIVVHDDMDIEAFRNLSIDLS
jgi:hypothetical protein